MENESLKIDEVLAKLDQSSRKARLISFAITILAITVASAVLIFLSSQIWNANNELTKINTLIESKKQEFNNTYDDPNLSLQQKIDKCRESLNELDPVATQANIAVTPTPTKIIPSKTLVPPTTPTVAVTPVIKQTEKATIIYFQVVDRSRISKSRTLANVLIGTGLPVADKTETRSDHKGKLRFTTVKFFNRQDETIAKDLAARLRSQNVENVTFEFSPLKAQLGQLEVWFSDDF